MKKLSPVKLFYLKIVVIILFSLSLNLSPLTVPKAYAWETYITIPLGVMLDNMISIVKGVLLGSLKQQAAQSLNKEISLMVGGSSSGNAMFVTDWKDYLVSQPQKKSQLYMNAYIDQATSGRGSRSQYIPTNSEGFGLSVANYNNQLKVGAMATVVNPATPKVTYVGQPSQMFAQGNFRNLSLYLSGINNPWAFNLHMQGKIEEVKEAEQLAAVEEIRAGAGFVGTKSEGKTITPGILIKEQMTGAQNMGFNIIASATNIPEVITAIVSQMVIKSSQQGIGNAKANIQKEVAAPQNQAANQMSSATQKYGPGAQYSSGLSLSANNSGSTSSSGGTTTGGTTTGGTTTGGTTTGGTTTGGNTGGSGGSGKVDLTFPQYRGISGPTSGRNNVKFNITTRIVNNGTDSAGQFVVKLYFSLDKAPGGVGDTLLGTWNVSQLGPGQTLEHTFSDLRVTGAAIHVSYYIIAQVDADGNISETNEDNNIHRATMGMAR